MSPQNPVLRCSTARRLRLLKNVRHLFFYYQTGNSKMWFTVINWDGAICEKCTDRLTRKSVRTWSSSRSLFMLENFIKQSFIPLKQTCYCITETLSVIEFYVFKSGSLINTCEATFSACKMLKSRNIWRWF